MMDFLYRLTLDELDGLTLNDLDTIGMYPHEPPVLYQLACAPISTMNGESVKIEVNVWQN